MEVKKGSLLPYLATAYLWVTSMLFQDSLVFVLENMGETTFTPNLITLHYNQTPHGVYSSQDIATQPWCATARCTAIPGSAGAIQDFQLPEFRSRGGDGLSVFIRNYPGSS